MALNASIEAERAGEAGKDYDAFVESANQYQEDTIEMTDILQNFAGDASDLVSAIMDIQTETESNKNISEDIAKEVKRFKKL